MPCVSTTSAAKPSPLPINTLNTLSLGLGGVTVLNSVALTPPGAHDALMNCPRPGWTNQSQHHRTEPPGSGRYVHLTNVAIQKHGMDYNSAHGESSQGLSSALPCIPLCSTHLCCLLSSSSALCSFPLCSLRSPLSSLLSGGATRLNTIALIHPSWMPARREVDDAEPDAVHRVDGQAPLQKTQ